MNFDDTRLVSLGSGNALVRIVYDFESTKVWVDDNIVYSHKWAREMPTLNSEYIQSRGIRVAANSSPTSVAHRILIFHSPNQMTILRPFKILLDEVYVVTDYVL